LSIWYCGVISRITIERPRGGTGVRISQRLRAFARSSPDPAVTQHGASGRFRPFGLQGQLPGRVLTPGYWSGPQGRIAGHAAAGIPRLRPRRQRRTRELTRGSAPAAATLGDRGSGPAAFSTGPGDASRTNGPEDPGPFAFASEARVRHILGASCFSAVGMERCDMQPDIAIGGGLDAAVEAASRSAPRLLRQGPRSCLRRCGEMASPHQIKSLVMTGPKGRGWSNSKDNEAASVSGLVHFKSSPRCR
jgi:hypothetical protein